MMRCVDGLCILWHPKLSLDHVEKVVEQAAPEPEPEV